ncbi:MAG: (5-formylfuran-3-yl)methyl phosphate synthase [Candidatus Lokiarchaeota archaeon]|nr:(5-formylfuran-3-yl)methyl phosphate synthase [Candidatus Lokiarchaeota archaeon]
MQLLVSPRSSSEAIECVKGGTDIVDIKNPDEGSLGANFPWIIKDILKVVPDGTPVSAAIGDLPNLPGTASLAACCIASCGVNYVKAGLKGVENEDEAINLMKKITRAVKENNKDTKVVAAAYADYKRFGTINPLLVPEIAEKAGCDIAMIDTGIKDGKSLFDFLKLEQLEKFIEDGHKRNLEIALAGSLKEKDFPVLKRLAPDIIGIRGAACEKNDRLNGSIKSERIKALKSLLQ